MKGNLHFNIWEGKSTLYVIQIKNDDQLCFQRTVCEYYQVEEHMNLGSNNISMALNDSFDKCPGCLPSRGIELLL